jgi:hypothetical protein
MTMEGVEFTSEDIIGIYGELDTVMALAFWKEGKVSGDLFADIFEATYTGTLEEKLQDIDGGLRSCCTYIGCSKMKHFSKHTTFFKVHKQLNTIFANCENI